MADRQKNEKQSFEQAIARLEAIVGEMEGGSLDLEKMISDFEEGQTLIAFCTNKLNEIEKKVEKLVKRGDKLTTEPFEPEAESLPDAGEAPPEREDELF
jgi:exodeoxyribonuclease VII small subunit